MTEKIFGLSRDIMSLVLPSVHTWRRKRRLKTTSRPRGRRRTAKASCSVPWAAATHPLNIHVYLTTRNAASTSQRSRGCGAAAEPSAQPHASGIKAKHLQTASFWQVPFRREPRADRDASSTVNPQPESGEQVTQRRAPAPLLVSGVHTQLISSVADGEHHTASGDGDRRRGPYDSTVQWLWDKTTTIPPNSPPTLILTILKCWLFWYTDNINDTDGFFLFS